MEALQSLVGQEIKIVRQAHDGIELTLTSTYPAVTLCIQGNFALTYYENKESVIPTDLIRFKR